MNIPNKRLKELLVNPGHIAEADFELAAKEAREQEKDIQDILAEKELIRDEQLGQLLAENSGFPFVNLKNEKIDEGVLNLIPELVARSKGAIVFGRDKEAVKAGMTNPEDLETRHLIEKRVGQKVLPFYITSRDLRAALEFYNNSLKDEFDKILKSLRDKNSSREEREMN